MSLLGKSSYTGRHSRNLDDKGRITIPSEWRAAHADTDRFMAIPMEGGYVAVLPPSGVQRLRDKVEAIPMSDREAQQEADEFFSRAQEFTFDKQGRIALDEELLGHAGIAKDAMLVGSMTKFSIYSSERWTQVKEKRGATGTSSFFSKYQI